jgi:alpha-beta hydrolase superfamily lysophospholipase
MSDVTSEDFFFSVGDERLAATRILSCSGRPPGVVSFHGLGVTASLASIRYVLDHLAELGLSSICFDFSGNGESSGRFECASLRIRATESLAAARLLAGSEPRALIGTSMGAHLAALAAPAIQPHALVLFCPAAYPEDAADQRFGENFVRFNNRVTTPETLRASLALRALRGFTGNLLVVAAEQDQVIPRHVVDLYLESATAARSSRVLWLAGCDHFVHPWLARHPEERAAALQAIQSTILDR